MQRVPCVLLLQQVGQGRGMTEEQGVRPCNGCPVSYSCCPSFGDAPATRTRPDPGALLGPGTPPDSRRAASSTERQAEPLHVLDAMAGWIDGWSVKVPAVLWEASC